MLTNQVSLEYSVLSTGLSVKVEMSIMVATATWYWRDVYLVLISSLALDISRHHF